jgi:hypothetical protein
LNHRQAVRGTKFVLALIIVLCFSFGIQSPAHAQAVILYQNDFETPNVPVTVTCGQNLNGNSVNTNYGQTGFTFQQIATVETVVVTAPGYSDPTGRGGNYSLGMLSSIQDDRVSMTFNAQNKPFINVQFDTATISPNGCGVGSSSGIPSFIVRAYDAPNGNFNINSPGTPLDSETVTGVNGSGTTYNWATVLASLDISGATTAFVAVYWDLTAPTYATIDNLVISSSSTGGGVGTVNITESGGSTNIAEGGATDTYTVALASVPLQPVTITVSPAAQCDLGNGAGTAITLTFPANANALLPQTVTVTAVDDAVIEGNHSCAVTHTSASSDPSYNGAGVIFAPNGTVTAQITDNDPPTATPTASNTPTETLTPSNTPTETLTPSNTPTETLTPSNTPTETLTPSNTPTETLTPSNTPTETLTPSNTPTETLTPSNTPTETLTPSNTPTSTATVTNTPVPPRPDTIGVYKDGVWALRNTNSAGAPDIVAVFGGDTSDLPLAGDWNGDGVDTIGLFRTGIGRFFLSDSNTAPTVSYTFLFGNPDDIPFAGRWDNSTTHSGVGVYRPSNGVMYQANNLVTGFSDYFAIYGNPGDKPVAGDWEGNGFDSIGVYRTADQHWHLTNNSTPNGVTFGDFDFLWDIWTNAPVVGDWDGNITSTVAYFTFDGNFALHSTNATVGTDNVFAFGAPGGKPVSGKWIAANRPALGGVIGSGQPGSSGGNADTGSGDAD